jgi:hypothetical protein
VPVSRPICLVSPNSIESIFPDPFGPEIRRSPFGSDIELSNAPHFFDMSGFEFGHFEITTGRKGEDLHDLFGLHLLTVRE